MDKRSGSGGHAESANWLSTAGFSTVELSCVIDSPFSRERSNRRTILPDRIFGMLSPKRISFGFAIGPIHRNGNHLLAVLPEAEGARVAPHLVLVDMPLGLLRYTQALITQMAQTAVCNRHHSIDQQLCRWLLLSVDRLSSNELRMTQELIDQHAGRTPIRRHRSGVETAGRRTDSLHTRPY
jgi:hypothetical protein